jgi:2,4-diketo-3-deoxy-L-fuconate hydrolase
LKLCRFDDDRYGLVRGDLVLDVTAAVLEAAGDGPSGAEPVIAALDALRTLPAARLDALDRHQLAAVSLRAPLRWPGKIIGAAVNYRAHVAEMKQSGMSDGHHIEDALEAGLFLKATSSLVGPAEGIALRFPDRRTDHEIELVAIIGTVAADVPREMALDHVAGYCLGLDVTLRGPEDRSFRKSIDSYSVLGPWLTTADEIADPQAILLSLRNNGALRQHASTADMIHGVADLIAFASRFYTLYPGDVLFTGTPPGVAALQAGDRLEAEADGLGRMIVAIRA